MHQKITSILIILFLSSCGAVYFDNLPHTELSSSLDFSEYAKKNFHFTTDVYRGKYISYGYLTEEIYPEVKYIHRGDVDDYDNRKYYKTGNCLVEILTYKEVLAKIYTKAVELGADGFMDLSIQVEEHPSYVSIPSTNMYAGMQSKGYGIKITGLAIKRLD